MKKALVVVLMFVATNAMAGMERSPIDMYSMRNNMMTNKTTVNIKSVDNINKTCEAESKSRGFGGFGIPMEACSFWDRGITGYSCTIFVGPKANNDILGHELRHCFQGAFH